MLIVFGLLLGGMGLLRGELIVLAIPLLAYLAVSAMGKPEVAAITAERTVSDRIMPQNGHVSVGIGVFSQDEKIDELYIQDTLPQGLELDGGKTSWLGSLAPGGSVLMEYSVRSSRGRFAYQSLHIEARDHFDLFRVMSDLYAPGEFQVFPQMPKLKNIRILPSQTRGFLGPIPSRQRGTGMVFWGVREFHVGDSLRQVNWKVTSRQREDLFTNEFEMERIADVGLILDARRQMDLAVHGESLFEYSVLATAALADAFLSDGHRVSMLIYGYGLERVYPGYGKIQRERILHTLAGASPGSNFALENFNHLPTRLFPAKSQLVVISPVDLHDLPAYIRLRRNGYEVMVVSPNPVDFEKNAFMQTPALERAYQFANIERSLRLKKLTRIGIKVVDWSIDQPLDKAMHASLGRMPVFRRNPKMVFN